MKKMYKSITKAVFAALCGFILFGEATHCGAGRRRAPQRRQRTQARRGHQRQQQRVPANTAAAQAQPAPALQAPQPRGARTIVRNRFFEDIVGLSENDFRRNFGGVNQRGKLRSFNWNGLGDWIKANPRRKAIFHGTFEAPTIAELDRHIAQKPMSGGGSLKIILHNPNAPEKTDIRYLQAHPNNKGAAFQIASTFFGPLEGGMYKPQSRLSNMVAHAVQGEEACISAAPAAIYRKYFMPIDRAHGHRYYLLNALHNKLPMGTNGRGNKYVDVSRYNRQANDEKSVAIGIHHDIYVTSGHGQSGANGSQTRLGLSADQRITQIFTSALPTKFFRKNGQALAPNEESAARMLLNAAYEGTIKAAYAKGIKKLYLTLVGGGAFRNEIEWIAEAIERMEDFIRASGMEVILLYRPDKERPKDPVQIRDANKDFDFVFRMLQLSNKIRPRNGLTHSLQHSQLLRDDLRSYLDASYTRQRQDQQVLDHFEQARLMYR